MFDQFGEKTRLAMAYALEAARQDGRKSPEAIHFLVGLARANPDLFKKLGLDPEEISKIHAARRGKKLPNSALAGMIPFSENVRLVLKRASEETKKSAHRHVGTGHLLLALFLEDSKTHSIFEKKGITGEKVRMAVADEAQERMFPPQFMNTMRSYTGRSGIGYDLHRLEPGRKLRIGGIEVAFDKGSVGHSDGDVLAHAICDALLGAGGLGDIGTHFPDTDPKWKGADSLEFLRHVRTLYDKEGLHIFHIDAIVIAERPKLGPHFPAMREALAGALGIEIGDINLKAKTNEGVDAIGRGEAIAAYAVASIAG